LIEEINSLNGEKIKCVNDFKYLGSWIDNTLKDINVRRKHKPGYQTLTDT